MTENAPTAPEVELVQMPNVPEEAFKQIEISQAEAEKASGEIVTDVKDEAAEAFAKLVAEEEKIVQEAQRIAHVVVQEVEQIATHVEVAAENVVRKAINVVIPHGGGSVIKNPG